METAETGRNSEVFRSDRVHQKVGERSSVTRKEKESSFPIGRWRIVSFWANWVVKKNRFFISAHLGCVFH